MSITLYERAKAESEGTAERTFQRPGDTVPQSHEQSSRGRVFLVGAGPGDPELVTLKGLHILRRADIVVYDRLICPELLDEAPSQAERVFVGKESGRHSMKQEEINALLIKLAQQGHLVVRLKGGDPFVFGRGGEEALALAHAGIPFEVVPGVSSAIAVPAYAGIPVTHRNLASSVTIVTGHEQSSCLSPAVNWEALAMSGSTLVILMGVETLSHITQRLLAGGLHPDTPAAVIQQGTVPQQRVITDTLLNIAERARAAKIKSPTVTVIGSVVALSDFLAWFQEGVQENASPLAGVSSPNSPFPRLAPQATQVGYLNSYEKGLKREKMKLLLSCISTNHSVLKQHWTETSQQTECPLTVLGSYQKPKQDLGGLLCFIEDLGCSQKTVELKMPAGMVASDRGVFVTSFGNIHEVDTDSGTVHQNVVSSPLFNALHSLSRTRRGYLVASTGIDLLVEFNRDGEILWSWWATDHGFELTPTGQKREIDKAADHRVIQYGTLSQTTHVNSAAELHDGRFLASLFHQGMVIMIDRTTGEWQPVLEGLDHPHSVRVLDEQHFTVADTVHGRALLVRLDNGNADIVEEVDAGTSWLQDCRFDGQHDCWILVDGKKSRVILRRGRSGKKTLAQFDFDPEWRLYETHVL